MRPVVLPLLAALIVAPHPLPATAAPAPGDASQADAPGPDHAATLDRLYERLAAAKTQAEADALVMQIERERLASGSDVADLLMTRALAASSAGDNPLAIELISAVIRLKPDFVEAWNKRATILFLERNFTRAMADIAETLKREPRHWGAWAGLGMILMETGDDKRAYDAFRKALAINPFLEQVRKTVDEMRVSVEGQDI